MEKKIGEAAVAREEGWANPAFFIMSYDLYDL